MIKKRSIKKSSEESHHADHDAGGCGCCMSSHPHLDKYFKDISQESTIQGVKYIGSKDLHPVERLFWAVILLISVGFSLYLVNNVYRKYNANPVIISFQPQEISVASIPFPAITICSVNLLRTSVIKAAYEELIGLVDVFKLNRSDPIMETKVYESLAHIDHLSQFCLSAKSFRRHLNQPLVDANGLPDLLQGLEGELREYNANLSAKLIKVEENNPKWWKEDMHMFDQAAINCEDLLLKCMWAADILPCKDIFFHVATRHGRCCVFNMMPKFILQSISEDEGRAKLEKKDLPKEVIDEWKRFGREDLIQRDMDKVAKINYPKHQMAGGKQYGLTVIANPDLQEYSTCTANDGWGFKIVAHSPVSSPTIMDYGAAVPPASEVFVNIEPEVTVVADDDVLAGIDIEKRGCLMLNEPKAKLKHYNFYSPENCFSECWADLTFKNCSCVRDFMPRNSSQRLCRARNRICADEVRANIAKTFGKNSLCGHCKASCTEILYKQQISHFDMREDTVSSYLTFESSQGNQTNATNYSIIHFYMGTDSLYAKERKPLYDKFDLIANSGGLLSLTLGISIISFVEMFYFCTLRAWFKFRSIFKDNQDNHGTGKQTMFGRRKSSTATIFPHDEYYNWSAANSAIGKKNRNQKPNLRDSKAQFHF